MANSDRKRRVPTAKQLLHRYRKLETVDWWLGQLDVSELRQFLIMLPSSKFEPLQQACLREMAEGLLIVDSNSDSDDETTDLLLDVHNGTGAASLCWCADDVVHKACPLHVLGVLRSVGEFLRQIDMQPVTIEHAKQCARVTGSANVFDLAKYREHLQPRKPD